MQISRFGFGLQASQEGRVFVIDVRFQIIPSIEVLQANTATVLLLAVTLVTNMPVEVILVAIAARAFRTKKPTVSGRSRWSWCYTRKGKRIESSPIL